MADQQNTIKTTVELDASQAQIEIVKLNNKASDSTKTLEERVIAKNKQVKLQDELSKKIVADLEAEVKALKKAGASQKDIEKATKKLNAQKIKATKLSESGAKAQSKLTASLKSSKSATENLDKASGGLLGKFKLLATNPIGVVIIALVGAVTLLTKAFASSEEGQNKVAKIMGVLSSVMGNLMDVVAGLAEQLFDAFSNPQETIERMGEKIKENITNRLNGLMELIPQLSKAIKSLFEGDFSGAAETAGNAVAKVVLGTENLTQSIRDAGKALAEFADEVAADAKAAEAIADKRAKADKVERDLIVSRAAAQRDLAKIKGDIVRKDLYDAKEREALALRAFDIANKLAKQEQYAAQLRYDAIVAENALSNSNKADLDAEANAKAKLIQIEAARFQKQVAFASQLNSIRKEQEGVDKIAETEKQKFRDAEDKYDAEQLVKAQEQKAKDEEERILQNELQNELDELDIERRFQQGEKVLELELALLERKRLQDLAYADISAKEIQLINEEAEFAKGQIRDASEKAEKRKEEAVLSNAIQGAAESFGIAQEVAVAKMIMAAPEAVAGSFKEAAKAYTPPLSLAMGALGAAGTVAPIVKGLIDIKKARFSKGGGGGSKGGSIPTFSASSAGGSAPPPVATELISDIAANNSARLGIDPNLGNAAGSAAANNVQGGSAQGIVFSESKYSSFQDQVKFKEEKIAV